MHHGTSPLPTALTWASRNVRLMVGTSCQWKAALGVHRGMTNVLRIFVWRLKGLRWRCGTRRYARPC